MDHSNGITKNVCACDIGKLLIMKTILNVALELGHINITKS